MGRFRFLLRRVYSRAVFDRFHCLHTELRTCYRQLIKEASARLIFRKRYLLFHNHIPGVNAFVHAHNRHT